MFMYVDLLSEAIRMLDLHVKHNWALSEEKAFLSNPHGF